MARNRNRIHIDTWVREEKERLDRFAKFYREQRAEGKKEEWPLLNAPGEWDDQYHMYEE